MNANTFVLNVEKIAAKNPSYRTGGSGKDSTCDCIGLVMGALGKKFPMHSTNYFVRYEVDGLRPVDDPSDLHPGTLVFKSRNASSNRYDLHERYKQGGRYYTGDLNDYYHVGVVTSDNPFTVTHCTDTGLLSGIARDHSPDAWHFAAEISGMTFEEKQEVDVMTKYATVVADSGFTVNVRKRPDKNSPVLFAVPIEETVEVSENAGEWATVTYNGNRGYMMAEFLEFEPIEAVETGEEFVTLTLPKSVANALYEAIKGVGA